LPVCSPAINVGAIRSLVEDDFTVERTGNRAVLVPLTHSGGAILITRGNRVALGAERGLNHPRLHLPSGVGVRTGCAESHVCVSEVAVSDGNAHDALARVG